MRFSMVAAAGLAGFMVMPAAHAQTSPAKSADQIVCELTQGTENCDESEVDSSVELQLPDEASFDLRTGDDTPKRKPVANNASRRKRVVNVNVNTVVKKPRKASEMSVEFALGSADLTDGDKVNIGEYAKALMTPQLAGSRVRVEGHTDAVGARAYNLQLSRDRAASVKAYLVELGVPAGRLDAEGYGFDRPLNPSNPRGSANRRVEIVLAN